MKAVHLAINGVKMKPTQTTRKCIKLKSCPLFFGFAIQEDTTPVVLEQAKN